MLDYFQQFGQTLASRFAQANYDHACFPDLAAAALHAASLPQLDFAALLSALAHPQLPQQRLDDHFSDLPLVLFHHPYFRIDLLCWLKANTSIHQHAFSGAFKVWQGRSLHSQYRFIEEQRFNTMLRFGQVLLERCELLPQGAVRRIVSAAGLTHGVFHLDEPTYTLLIRTHSEPWNGPQLALVPPAVAYAPDYLQQQLEPLRQLLLLIEQVDRHHVAHLLIAHLPQIDTAALAVYGGWWMSLAQQAQQADAFLAAVTQHHGSRLAAALPEAAQQQRKIEQGYQLREQLTQEPLRYLTAVLMNTQQRQTVLDLMAQYQPTAPAASLLSEWLWQLLQSESLALPTAATLPKSWVEVLLHTTSEHDFIAQLHRHHSPSCQQFSLDQQFEFYHRVRALPIMQAVFS